MTHQEILDAMGNLATDEEADAMEDLLLEREVEELDDISDYEFFALIPEAAERKNRKPPESLAEMTEDDLEYSAPNHNREWCTCPYCSEIRRREVSNA